MSLTVRRAGPADVATLSELNAQVHAIHADARPDVFVPVSAAALAEWFGRMLERAECRVWLAEVDGIPAGYLLAMIEERPATPFTRRRTCCEVDQVGVAEAMRRRGVARALVEAAASWARELGVDSMAAQCWAFNTEAQAGARPHLVVGTLNAAVVVEMAIPKPKHLKRYQQIAWLLVKHARSDLAPAAGLDEVAADSPAGREMAAEAESLADDLEALGPTFVKLGQLLSTRPDLLPPAYLNALARLHDKVEPFSFAEVEQIVAGELGVRLSKAFGEFESTPLAAASLGQVHRARLRDGRRVAVKVQRPGVRERVMEDLEALEYIGSFLDSHTEAGRRFEFARLLEEFRRSVLRELDYIQEGGHLVTLRRNLAGFPRLFVPAPVEDYTTSRVLTMEYVTGTKVTALSPVVLQEVNGHELVEALVAAYLKQILVDGFFHADPHPGNVLLTEDGRLALIDLGMVGYVTPRMQDYLLQLLLSVSDGRPDEAATYAIKLGQTRENFDETSFRRKVADLVAQKRDAAAEDMPIGRSVLELAWLSGECGLRLPPELAMLGKTLLHLDEIGRRLDRDAPLNALVRRHTAAILQQRLVQSLAPGNLLTGVLETKELVERLPERLNRFLDRLANNQLQVKVDAIDENALMIGIQKVANRITMGLLLAALIIGAAMLMQVETTFRLFGYPGLAMIFFLLAGAGGVALMATILFRDRKCAGRGTVSEAG